MTGKITTDEIAMKTKVVDVSKSWMLVVVLWMLYGLMYGQRTYSVVYPFGPVKGEGGSWSMRVVEDSGWVYVWLWDVEFSEEDVMQGRDEVLAVFGPNGRLVYLTADEGTIGRILGSVNRWEDRTGYRGEEWKEEDLIERLRKQLEDEGVEMKDVCRLKDGGYVMCGGEDEGEELGDGGAGYGVLARYDEGGRVWWYRRYGWRKVGGSDGGDGLCGGYGMRRCGDRSAGGASGIVADRRGGKVVLRVPRLICKPDSRI